jgi:hypothetical protein
VERLSASAEADDAERRYAAALGFALCGSAARETAPEDARRWEDRAVAGLRSAMELGLANGARALREPAWRALAGRDDFPKLP